MSSQLVLLIYVVVKNTLWMPSAASLRLRTNKMLPNQLRQEVRRLSAEEFVVVAAEIAKALRVLAQT